MFTLPSYLMRLLNLSLSRSQPFNLDEHTVLAIGYTFRMRFHTTLLAMERHRYGNMPDPHPRAQAMISSFSLSSFSLYMRDGPKGPLRMKVANGP